MEDIAIEVKGVTKFYKLYRSRNERVRDWLFPSSGGKHTNHYALRDISLEVKKGEIVGIIGQNGSGKSTLLKILTGVVTPSSGQVICRGNVTSLLELGAGFNNELTGIENIYYLGAIQGHTKQELDQKMQEILSFAEIGEYAWQPVKNYSSGMYVRLAFSLAIHIDPEILIIDEALSVGDIRFQQKCYRKIREFKDQGKTIVLCTHSMQAVRDFCTKAMWIHNGTLKEIGSPDFITECYTNFMATGSRRDTKLPESASKMELPYPDLPWVDINACVQSGVNPGMIVALAFQSRGQAGLTIAKGDDEITATMLIQSPNKNTPYSLSLSLQNSLGFKLMHIISQQHGKTFYFTPEKVSLVTLRFTMPHLTNGQYSLSAAVLSEKEESWETQHRIHDALFFEMHTNDAKYHSNAPIVVQDVHFSQMK